jgi:hypothetical protein
MVPRRQDQAVGGGTEAVVPRDVELPEVGIASAIAQLLDHLEIRLRRNDHDHAEDERHDESQGTLSNESPDTLPVEEIAGRDAGDEEQQGQPPGRCQHHQRFDHR